MEESKRAKNKLQEEEEEEDRISDLPDHIIHHILSLLPSTKEAVRTGILSKRWKNQWTSVPVLIFNSYTSGMSSESFLKFVDNTLILHHCSKINKFCFKYLLKDTYYPQFSSKIRFAITKAVEDLYLIFAVEYKLPIFLFNNASLVTLVTRNCSFMPNGKVNSECLTTLGLGNCRLADQVMDLILSGSPLPETLSLISCVGFTKLVIASKSLIYLRLEQFLNIFDIDISCPKLKRLKLVSCLNVRTTKLLNVPPLLCATIDFNHLENECNESRMSLIKDILDQLRHVKVLTIGSWFMENMSSVLAGGQFSPVFNVMKCLFLKSHNFSVIACLLRNSPLLEKLHIDMTLYDQDYQDFGENYWSDATVFKCLVSHLKTIKIGGFPKSDGKRKVMLNFVQFFLKNARVLEKMIFYLKDDGRAFALKVSQELSTFPRFSRSAIIKFVYS